MSWRGMPGTVLTRGAVICALGIALALGGCGHANTTTTSGVNNPTSSQNPTQKHQGGNGGNTGTTGNAGGSANQGSSYQNISSGVNTVNSVVGSLSGSSNDANTDFSTSNPEVQP